MNFLLMHKNIPVAQIGVDTDGQMKGIKRNIHAIDHLPLGCQLNDMKFHEWWKDRAVPKTRKGTSAALKSLGFTNTNSMLVNNLALSLNDCYWIKPINSDAKWEQVSLFRNNFIDIFGELTFDNLKKNRFKKQDFI